MELEERVSTARVQQEDSFMMANLIIHSSSRASVAGPQEAGRRRSKTNSRQGSHPTDTHARNGCPCTSPKLHPPASSVRNHVALILLFWPLKINTALMTGFQHNSLFPVMIDMDVQALDEKHSFDFSCMDQRDRIFLL